MLADSPINCVHYTKKIRIICSLSFCLKYIEWMPIHCLYIDFHRKPPILKPATDRGTKYSQELQNLQKMLHFPEEVALLLTETEHALFTCVPPAHYIRQVTTDISRGSLVYHKVSSVEDLIQRFNEVVVQFLLRIRNSLFRVWYRVNWGISLGHATKIFKNVPILCFYSYIMNIKFLWILRNWQFWGYINLWMIILSINLCPSFDEWQRTFDLVDWLHRIHENGCSVNTETTITVKALYLKICNNVMHSAILH